MVSLPVFWACSLPNNLLRISVCWVVFCCLIVVSTFCIVSMASIDMSCSILLASNPIDCNVCWNCSDCVVAFDKLLTIALVAAIAPSGFIFRFKNVEFNAITCLKSSLSAISSIPFNELMILAALTSVLSLR